MAISRAQALKELLPGLNALFGLEYAKYEDEHAGSHSPAESKGFMCRVRKRGLGSGQRKAQGAT